MSLPSSRLFDLSNGKLQKYAIITQQTERLVIDRYRLQLTESEAISILQRAQQRTLHKDVVTVEDQQYIITTVRQRSFYGIRLVGKVPGGICLVMAGPSLIVAVYNELMPPQVVPSVEQFADEMVAQLSQGT
ncbi:hypothetical protein PAPYR_27 [Paratrimastix pyriformis]|uniref:Profilin n=1 Tax=Paratrimastix pyriformis TaxID=342808 RepID=A0ABQ8UUP7_9EUKA|nr:hypothetical protein PAPYR_27 [Paratrimastix pyriformis]